MVAKKKSDSESRNTDLLDGVLSGEEDCLMLNIYVPEHDFESALPVMAWIHGGALIVGSNRIKSQGPQEFMDRNVIIVTINYRLGPLGFLSLGTDQVPGNAGLRDQSMALKWVNKNIASFGGDPEMVTIFGESAGALSVHLHLISPLSQGLFHRAIIQSSTALEPSWGPICPKQGLIYSSLFEKAMSCDQENTLDILTCLQSRDMADTLALPQLLEGGNTPWMAVSDNDFTSDPFLPGKVEELMASGEFNTDVEIIIGTNAEDGMNFLLFALADPSLFDNYQMTFNTSAPMGLFDIPFIESQY